MASVRIALASPRIAPTVADALQAVRASIVGLTRETPAALLREVVHMNLPKHYGVREGDVDLKRLGSVLLVAQESETETFEDLLLLRGLGPRTLQALALVSEVIHGDPVRFRDPARFAFAHGGKGGSPFPVPTRVYDETIDVLRSAVDRARMGQTDKAKALRSLTRLAQRVEAGFTPTGTLQDAVDRENAESHRYGGRTAQGVVPSPSEPPPSEPPPERDDLQLDLFA